MQLDHKAVEILKKVSTDPGMSLRVLCERIGLPQRNFYYRRVRINDWLSAHGFAPLVCDARRGVRVADDEATGILQQLGVIKAQDYKLSAEERRDNLLLHLCFCPESTFIHHFSELNRVSRNTSLKDISLLKQYLQCQQLTLVVEKKRGYRIEGSCVARRLVVQRLLQHTLKYSDRQAESRIAQLFYQQQVAAGLDPVRIQQKLGELFQQTELQLNCTFSDKDRRVLYYMVLFSLLDTYKGHYPQFTSAQARFLRKQTAWCEIAASLNTSLSRELGFPDISGNTLFFSLLLSASKKVASCQWGECEDSRLSAAIKQLIVQFQMLSGIYLSDVEQLEARLFSHLGPAIFRCLFDLSSENVLKEEIQIHYPLIFRFCREIIASLEQEFQIAFCDDELSYIVMNFATWLDRRPETAEQHVLLVTEGGVSSTAILENQLRNLTVLPLFIEQVSASQLQQQGIGPHIRLVVSTVRLCCPVPSHVGFVQTQHILTGSEKQQLRLLLEHNIDAAGISGLVSALVASASRLAPQAMEPLRLEFCAIIHQFLQKQQRDSQRPLLQQTISHLTYVNFTASHASWRQVIRKAAQPLVEAGIVDAQYPRNIVRQIERQGITTYLTPEILLLHDAPPEGVTRGALSLLKLKHPLQFDTPGVELNPSLIVILVPTENLTHLSLLEFLNVLISDENTLARLLSASSVQELRCCINSDTVR
ncbi:BglG family transcription antiterminator [Kluyvera intermedia]|uniref:BglG family transcription antiterminator n=1 Tax=Kluyvera intermedia TaxID=61648 RepID=UPI00352567DE